MRYMKAQYHGTIVLDDRLYFHKLDCPPGCLDQINVHVYNIKGQYRGTTVSDDPLYPHKLDYPRLLGSDPVYMYTTLRVSFTLWQISLDG